MTEYRTEKDSLGELKVPADALYAAQTQRAVQNFQISGLPQYRAFIWSMATIKRAAAEVNAELGLFSDSDGTSAEDLVNAIKQAADEVIAGDHDAHFVVDPFQAGAGTSHNMNTNEVIANRANQILGYALDDPDKPVHPKDHVNMAHSTNDTIPSAIRLGCLWRLEELTDVLDGLAESLGEKAREFDDILKSGRTHLQDAVPVRLGQEFGAYARAVERNTDKLVEAARGLRRRGIGGTATGSGLNAHPEYHGKKGATLEQLTGLEHERTDNLYESMQSMKDMVYYSGAMRPLDQDIQRKTN
ncbi:MAG: lyase family protein, partial [Anaerolineae bacterium]